MADQQNNQPALHIIAQYTKDFSFENPNAPEGLVSGWAAPETGVQITLRHRNVRDNIHETVLTLRIEAKYKEQDKAAFIIDLSYGALVQLHNIPAENVKPVLMIEVAKQLFPFAREIVADAVQKGGFPPLYLQPISFEALYTAEAQRQQQAAAQTGTA